MQSFTIFLAILGLSAAATLTTLNGKDFEEVMTDEVSKDALKPMMDLGAAVADQPEQKDEKNLEDSDTEVDSDIESRNTEEALDHPEDAPFDDGVQFPVNMFEKGMTMAFPAMMNEGATPYAAGRPNDQKQELRNGNGSTRPNGNGSSSAASASANSFSSGPNSFSGSQAQAFSRSFSNK